MTVQNLDQRYCWHPFTQHATELPPRVLARAKNASLYDENGNACLDLISSWWTCLHGHSHPALVEALSAQAATMAHVMFAGFTHEPAARLAADLAAVLPKDLSRVFFSDDGSTAVEVALKAAIQYWRNQGAPERQIIFTFEGGYHGDTLGAMSAGRGSGFFTLFEDLMCQTVTLPFPETWQDDPDVEEKEAHALEAFNGALTAAGNKGAALIIEPLLQGAGGMRTCRPAFIKALSKKAHEMGILVIFDEVAVGFGRTGTLFACEQADVVPDMICLAKGLTAGMLPMSVTVVRETIYEAFLGPDFSRALAHGHSFTANPMACAIARRSLQLFAEENTLDKIGHINKRHKVALSDLMDSQRIKRPRILGSVLAFDLAGTKAGYKSPESLFLRDWFLNEGLNIRPLGPTVYLMPPYCITDEELDLAYDGLKRGLEALR